MLKVRDLTVSFRTQQGTVRAVDGVSFDVAAGEVLGVVGESGSGKTMSLMAAMGLINDPNVTVEGSILFKGRELLGLAPRDMRQLRGTGLAMIFQDPMTALTPVYTIGWQIAEQLRAHEKMSAAAARARAVDLLKAVNIPDPSGTAGRYPHELSGGMRQRTLIAMALSCNPPLLICDEPTTALDVTVQAQILELILKLRREFGSAIVFITHDMGVIAEIADRVMVMYGSRVVETASKSEIFADPRHPYTRALLNSIPPMSGPRPKRLQSIPGAPPSLLDMPKGCAFSPRCPSRFEKCAQRPELVGEPAHRAACFLSPARGAA